MSIDKHLINTLSDRAWEIRDRASIKGSTKVGSSIYSGGEFFTGCNAEHFLRSHDIHAEVNAIGNMISSGFYSFDLILVVAERDRFTPCGACMDWIIQFGGKDCLVGFQSEPKGEIFWKKAKELMPYYPY
ncbi:MAG: hypothetical protein ABJR05_16640 [Balneola sp.]